MSFDLSGEAAASMQMICGGNVRLLIDYIPATPADTELFCKLDDALNRGEKCYLIASLGKVGKEKRQTTRCLVLEDRSVTGEFPYPQAWLDMLVEKAFRSTYPVSETIEGEQFVIEHCFVPSTVFICGAGHVSQKIAILAEMVDFRTVILDDRSEYANKTLFPQADSIKVLESFEDCFAGFGLFLCSEKPVFRIYGL